MLETLIDILMAFLGAAGFAMVFNVHRGRRLFWTGVGGAAGWIVYLLALHQSGSVFLAMFSATAIIVFLSEVLARTIKVPIIMLMVPMLIPLIPGGSLYYTMDALVQGDSATAAATAYSLATQAGAIAVGIIVMTSIMGNFFTFYYRRKRRRTAPNGQAQK